MGRGICLGDGIWTVRNDECDQIVAMPNGWRSPCKGENINKHESKRRKDTSQIGCAFVSREVPYLDIPDEGHTTCTQDEANREEGRGCGCVVVVAIVAVGFGGDRGRRGG